MNKKRITHGKGKLKKRFVSILTAATVATSSLPIAYIAELYGGISTKLSAFAAGTGATHEFNTITEFKNYVASYTASNKNDKLVFAITDGSSSNNEINIDTPMGASQNAAFDGEIIIQAPIKFNISKPLFTYVTDDVEIRVTYTGGTAMEFTRPSDGTQAPLFAEHVIDSRSSGSPVKWNFRYDKYSRDNSVYDFAGFIGVMEDNAKVEIESIVYNNKGKDQNNNDKTANIVANNNGDAGLICGTMKANAELTVDEVTCSGDNADASFSIKASSGSAGGLVGSMASGSTLTLGSELSCAQEAGSEIKADNATNGYAGGLVGKCDKGIIVNNSTDYTVVQTISGAKGSGGVAGYYETSSSNNAVNTNIVDLSTGGYKVNGAGQCGGLFGEVFNNDQDMTITIGGNIAPDHNNGGATSYGGLIGKYTSSAQTLSLTVTGADSNEITPSKSSGSAVNYGGVIGNVDLSGTGTSSYINIDGVKVNSSNAVATCFGGVIGKADNAFIELVNTNTISYSGINKDNAFAGIVGSLESGVLCLSGITDLSGAAGITNVKEPSGQIVGYRNCGFVYAESGWKLYRSSTGQKVDDIGSWGEVIRFGGNIAESDVITVDSSNHTVTLKKRNVSGHTDDCKNIANTTDFAIVALNAQHNSGTNYNVLRFTDFTSAKILGLDFSFAATAPIDLSGTGITGLTRDNSYDGNNFNSYMTYKGTSSSLKNMNGGDSTIKLAIGEEWGDVRSPSYGNGTVYRHKYNGLIARTDNVSFSNGDYGNKTLTLTGKINVEACTSDVNVGTLVANTINKVQIDNVNCNATINHAGNGSNFYVGGFIGNANGNITFGQNSGRPCSFSGSIIGSSSGSSAVVGGLIGCVNGNYTSNIYDATVSGIIKSQGGEDNQKIGGLIGVINGSTTNTNSKLNLKNVSVTNLTVESNATNSSGGLLGYGWYNTAVNFASTNSIKGVEITSSTMKTSAPKTAGLVYEGTGHWIVYHRGSNKEGIKITSATIDAANAQSFGGIINRGCANGAAIYLELKYYNGCGYKITSLTTTNLNPDVSVFDEIAAYSKFDDTEITDNGQAIISINTSNSKNNVLLKMDDSNSGSTYANQSGFTPKYSNAIDYCNPNTRYYYNLGLIIEKKTDKTAADNFMLWSVEQYAHSSIYTYFSGGNSGTEDADINLRGYSYYPINIDKDEEYTIAGNISLWNAEFDATEGATTWKRKSFGTARNSQHYLMQNGLFLNVNGTLNATSLRLNGDVSKISDDLCGALVMGTVSSDSSTDPAIVTVDGLVLNGIKVNGTHNASTYAPLLINKSGSNATFEIENVSATTLSGSTASTEYSEGQLIASSLIGNLGGADATFVKISFSGIKLDGRNATGNIDSLDSVYATKKSLFSRSTLLNSLKYNDNSSYGTYYFGFGEDYDTENSNEKLGNVTYGKEIRDTVENKEAVANTNPIEYMSKQLKYDGSNEYVRPVYSSPVDSNGFAGFSSNYQKYVYEGYVAENNTENKHELQVNIASASFSGCGTYNDPYIITKGDELETIAKIINGIDATTSAYSITVPKSVVDPPSSAHSWCITNENNIKEHYTFTSFTKGSTRDASTWSTSDSTPVTISDSALAKYLVGAYYKLNSTGDIELKTTFPGISTNVDSDYAFHGVIDGNGKSVVNRSVLPLISSSDGCVIMNLNITANPTESISLTANKVAFDTTSASAPAYGVLIGKVLSGDNIIDHVTAGFTGTGKISISGNSIVPVGGYIGVVRNGGVIFRNMSTINASARSGIKNTAFTDLNTPVTGNDCLYINPIIGRVLNGYAVTVAASGSTDDYEPSEDDVTMQNGTKNYSIADLDPDLGKLETANNTIKLPNAQSMFILSLLTQSGLTVASYGDYGTHFHKAAYNEIGSLATQEGDYAIVTATRPYIVEYYLDSTAQTNLSSLTGSGNEWNLSLGGTDTEWKLPDGFRGIGSLGFGQDDTYVNARTIYLKNFSSIGSYGVPTYAPEDTEHTSPTNIIDLKLNINVKHYKSDVDNYLPLSTSHGGLGLFDKFRQLNTSSANKISYVKLSGEINYDVPDITVYTKNNVTDNYLHVGGLAGCIGTGSETDNIIVNNIDIDGLTVNGFESAGGFFGHLNMANSSSGQVNISKVSADEFSVSAKRYAGGMIGYFGQGNLSVSDVEITQPNILTYYRGINNKDFENGAGGIVGYALNNNSNIPIQFSNVQLGSLKSEADDPSSFSISSRIGYAEGVTFNQTSVGTQNTNHNDTIVAGGLIGRSHTYVTSGYTYSMILTNCKVYNIDVYGHKVGGLLGSDIDKDSKIHITDCKVISDTDKKAQVYGMTIDAKDRGCGGIIGGNSNGGLIVDSCQVKGYILQGRNDTAAVCAWLDAGNLTIHNLLIKDVVIRSDYAGILVGYQNAEIEGYNILTDNVQFQDKDKSVVTDLTKKNIGYIVGKNLNGKSTKIAGFTRQKTTPETGYFVPDRMTGYGSKSTLGSGSTLSSDKFSYGGGYVIFADYQGSQAGTAFSDINAGSNITGDPKSPYVYSSPSVTISDGDEGQNTSPQILTGDGVSGYTYLESSAGMIFSQRSDSSNLKRYQQCTLANATVLGKVLENNTSSFTRELQKSGINSYSGDNFPVLVIDDKDNVDTIVKDYIRLLTNTSYNFDGKTTAELPIYSIDVSKMKYNSTKKIFETPIDQTTNQPEPAALNYSSSTGKYSIGDVYDNTDEIRFSLIDVQFKNPTTATATTGEIAYHLYIPVMIEKCLYYTVEIRPASGSTYNLDEYPNSPTNLIENFGNPVTIKLTYKYDQGYTEWTKAINNGENVFRNYNKEIKIKCPNLLNNAMAVIVDPNNNNDTMRSGNLVSSGTNALLTAEGGGIYTLSVANSSQVCKLNDLMKISIDGTATEKKLVSCDASAATVMVNYPDNSSVTYLRPATANELTNNSIPKYAVKVEDWGTKSVPEENYYISIFTQENKSNTTIYHYEIDTDSSLGDYQYPSSKTNDEVPHILIGNLYNNNVKTVNEGNPDTNISKSNNTLSATITAEVGFSQSALDNDITSLISGNKNLEIYQEFLVSLQKIVDNATSMGIEITPECSFTYAINGTPVDDKFLLDSKKMGIYIELPTEQSIKQALIDKVTTWKNLHPTANTVDADECKITLTSTVTMSYAKYEVDELVDQFPESSNVYQNGTKIVGYSKIASAQNSVALSHASHNKAGNRLYNMESASPVVLKYIVAENSNFANDGNADFGQLGINAQPDAAEISGGKSKIKTLISYDASDFAERESAEYLMLSFTLQDKNTSGGISEYGSALSIGDYLDGFKVNDYLYPPVPPSESDDEEAGDVESSEENTTPPIIVTESNNVRTFKIPLELLSNDNDGRYDYVIPVEFDVLSGSAFEAGESKKYSNYRISVEVGLLGADNTTTPLLGSVASDWIIYTNARIKRDIIT